jgi:hypothetical protein
MTASGGKMRLAAAFGAGDPDSETLKRRRDARVGAHRLRRREKLRSSGVWGTTNT